MLAYIMGLIQSYEDSHGHRPQLVYLNQKHLARLIEECPWLGNMEDRPTLGFRIILISEKELAQPRAVWIPPMPRVSRPTNIETHDGPYCLTVRH